MELFLPAVISAVIGILILVAFFGMSKNLREIRLDIYTVMKNKKADDKKALRVQIIMTPSLISIVTQHSVKAIITKLGKLC